MLRRYAATDHRVYLGKIDACLTAENSDESEWTLDKIAGWMALATRDMDAAIPNRNMVNPNRKVVKNH